MDPQAVLQLAANKIGLKPEELLYYVMEVREGRYDEAGSATLRILSSLISRSVGIPDVRSYLEEASRSNDPVGSFAFVLPTLLKNKREAVDFLATCDPICPACGYVAPSTDFGVRSSGDTRIVVCPACKADIAEGSMGLLDTKGKRVLYPGTLNFQPLY